MNFQAYQGYNETAVRNLQLNNVAENLYDEGSLTPPQYEQVKTDFPSQLNQPNLFVRIGLFIFTSLCISFSMGVGGLLFGSMSLEQFGIGVLIFLYGIGLTVLNENFIKSQKWYRQGSDNALCYASIACLVAGICLVGHIENAVAVSIVSFVFLSAATLRYGDPLLAFAAFYTLLYAFFNLIYESQIPFMAIPTIGVTLSYLIYYWSRIGSKRDDLFYWADCFTLLEIVSLVVLYASVNYWVIHTFVQNDTIKDIPTPYNWLFGFLTAVVPILYLAFGIQKKDRILWIIGGLGIVASIITYRYFHSIMPIEWALTLAGLALLFLGIFLIKYLKTPKNGFVYLSKPSKTNLVESLVMNQLLQQSIHSATPESNIKFGGGDFDGGGAESEY